MRSNAQIALNLPSAQAVRDGDRRALAKTITLIESRRKEDRRAANDLIERLLPHTGGSMRVALSGAPGAGKSTFIEQLGLRLIERDKKVAVLAIDPSSPLAGGSILGDKTRMERLAREPQAFIRPSPAGDSLGGVARRTRESLLLCEAAGFDVVLIETVGVGQSEHEAARISDFFATLVLPNAGDELQGIKRGILELADLILINKCDGEMRAAAARAKGHYESALRLVRRDAEKPRHVMLCSALEAEGIDEAWSLLELNRVQLQQNGAWQRRRSEQNLHWMRRLLHERLEAELTDKLHASEQMEHLSQQVANGELSPGRAVELIFHAANEVSSPP